MSGDLVPLVGTQQPATVDPAIYPRGLRDWSEELSAAADIANALVGTPFIPDSLNVRDARGELDYVATQAVVAATLLTGRELGLDPMASLRSVDIIKGTPAIRALTMRALVRSRGARIWTVESTSLRAVVQGQAVGEDHVEESTWDMARARDLGIATRPNWRSQPKVMLLARATAECARLVAPEALLGLPYAVEEVGDPRRVSAPAQDAERPAAARTARRRTIPGPAAAAATPDATPQPATQEMASGPHTQPGREVAATDHGPDGGKITQAQRNTMHALFRSLDIRDRAARLALSTQVIGRKLGSANDLTRDEATALIRDLTQRVQRRQADRAREAVEAAQVEDDPGDQDDGDLDPPGFDTPDPDLVD